MPTSWPHPEPTRSRFIEPLFSILSLPFNLTKGFCTLLGAVAMSVMMRRKARRSSYIGDQKQPSFSEKQTGGTTKVQVETTCPICQEPVGSRNPEGITEDWSSLPCGHQFGSHCIKHYLRIVADDRPSCPICRQTAYHVCGHPVLPTVINSTSTCIDAKKTIERVQNLQSTFCGFCRSGKGIVRMRVIKRPKTKLKAAGAWLLSLTTVPRRLLGRNRNRRREDVANGGSLLQPWEDDNGPWIDPFPRIRDPLWERWWDSQEPATLE